MGAKGKVTERDVLDFVAASPLWAKAPLLAREYFAVNPEPDLRLTRKIVDAKYPRAARIYGVVSSRDVDWNVTDPNGA